MPATMEMPDSAIKIYANDWVATVLTSMINDAGFFHVICNVEGISHSAAILGAEHILNIFAKGRMAMILAKPEANSETDFDTKIIHHRGYVRFSYKLEAGDWQYPDPSMRLSFGEQH